jgi:hypothetical protein
VEIADDVFNSLGNYFTTLSQFGYVNQNEVNKLLIYTFIDEMLDGDLSYYITDDDYRNIEQALNCLYGSGCLFPYPKRLNDDTIYWHHKRVENLITRLTEDSILRFSAEGNLRLKTLD